MKLLKLFVLSALVLPNSAFAEDYYVPIKKELEPMARIPMPAFRKTDSSVKYTLPADITGAVLNPIQITANLVGSFRKNGPNIYEGDKATLSCMGDNEYPACVVTHKNLGINKENVEAYLQTKYRDPRKLESARAVAKKFATDNLNELLGEDGSEPIGFISKRSDPSKEPVSKVWTIKFTYFDEQQKAIKDGMLGILDFNDTSLNFKEIDKNGVVLNDGKRAQIYGVHYDGFHWSGVLDLGSERRWFDMDLDTDKKALNGTWGLIENGKHLPSVGATLKSITIKP